MPSGTPATHNQTAVIKRHVSAASTLLEGLAAHHLSLSTAGQGDLETWLVSNAPPTAAKPGTSCGGPGSRN